MSARLAAMPRFTYFDCGRLIILLKSARDRCERLTVREQILKRLSVRRRSHKNSSTNEQDEWEQAPPRALVLHFSGDGQYDVHLCSRVKLCWVARDKLNQ